jgi:hypothetical protein
MMLLKLDGNDFHDIKILDQNDTSVYFSARMYDDISTSDSFRYVYVFDTRLNEFVVSAMTDDYVKKIGLCGFKWKSEHHYLNRSK